MTDHQFCGDSILTLIAEVARLRARCAEVLNLPVGAIVLSPETLALLVVDPEEPSRT